jgi:hypothetical protein
LNEINIYLILLLLVVFFLNSNYTFGGSQTTVYSDHNLNIIEHLTKVSSKTKNYRRAPQNFSSFGYAVQGQIIGEEAFMEYIFPLIESKESKFTIKLNTNNVSSVVNLFGCHTSCLVKTGGDMYCLANDDPNYLLQHMNRDGFYFREMAEKGFGIDYNHVIDISKDLSSRIALFISDELKKLGKDSYENRVRAALNFVQFMPYGVPDFDEGEHIYFGLALPHESFAISYSDCDSKSTLFAGILHHLISPENIILVGCTIEEGGHMITGVAGLHFPGQYIQFQGNDYLLIETTTPIPLEYQPTERFKDVEIIPILQQ